MTELSSFARDLQGWRLELSGRSELKTLAKDAEKNGTATSVDVCVHDTLAEKKTAYQVVALFRGVCDRLQTLTRIELYPGPGGYNRFPVEALTAVLQAYPHSLETLSVYHLELQGTLAKFREFAKHLELCRGLTEVCFIDCRADVPANDNHHTTTTTTTTSDNPFAPVLASLAKLSSLKVVALWADDSLGTLTQESLVRICKSKSLDRLLLMGFSVTDQEASGVFQTLEANGSLRRLHLSCEIGPRASKALAGMLRTNSKLEKLKIDLEDHRTIHNEDHLVEIARGLRENTGIHYFKLSGSFGSGSRRSVEAFEQTLSDNSSLEALSVLDGSVYSPKMAFFLKLNQQGRREFLQSTRREDWINGLVKSNGDLNCLFYILLANPTLMSSSTSTTKRSE